MSGDAIGPVVTPTASIRFNQGVLEQLFQGSYGTEWRPVLDIDPRCRQQSDAREGAEGEPSDSLDDRAVALIRSVDEVRRAIRAIDRRVIPPELYAALRQLYDKNFMLAHALIRRRTQRS